MKSLEGKVAIITGAAQGIGEACARRFAKAGAAVVIADINAERGEATASEIERAGGKAAFVQCNVGDSDQVDFLVRATVQNFKKLDVLVSNAGILHTADFLDLTEEDFDRVFQVNLKGGLFCGQAAARQMLKQGHGGSIINMSSINGTVAIPNQVPYCISKGALNQLTRVMALSLAKSGIRVNAIAPGSVLTELLKVVMNDDAARRKILSRTPLGRCGTPDEIAAVAAFLASDDANYITGEIITADGGRMPLNYTVPVE